MCEYSQIHRVAISSLDLSLQTRAATNMETVEEYAEAMADGAAFPPICVRDVGTADDPHLIVTDGRHRVEAAKLNGKTEILARVLPGALSSAFCDALRANVTNGLRRTNADKRHALEMAWQHRREIWRRNDGADPSAELLAKTCCLSLRMVKGFLSELQPVQNALVETAQPVQNALVETAQPVQNALVETAQPVMPRRVLGADGKVRTVPPKMPMRPAAPAVMGFNAVRNPLHVVPVDRYGVEIPVQLGGVFSSDSESRIKEMLSSISKTRSTLRNGLDCNDPLFAAMRQDALIQLNNAYAFIAAAQPHCICRICQGNGCRACHERGWQTGEEYERNPREFKAEGGAA